MTVEEARNIVRHGDHSAATYDLAERILVEAGDYRMAWFACRLAQIERRQSERVAKMLKKLGIERESVPGFHPGA